MASNYGKGNGSMDTKDAGREASKILTPFPVDSSSHKLPDTKGCKMGGSLTNLGHSLSGTSANQKGPR